ncbi:MAG: DUF5076 domain-containing protein [Burkholderiales bacterium]|jgi:Domain of unknown function (DUF5076)
MSKPYQALNIPPAANERGGIEVLRSAIIDGELHLTLRPLFENPNDWGRMFAECARQVARVYAQQNRLPEADTVARISSAFETEIKTPPAVKSAIGPLG